MSLSRSELEAMDRDELVETIVELSQRVDDAETTATVAADSLWDLEDVVVGETSVGFADGQLPADGLFGVISELREENERLRDANQDLRERIDEVEATAEQAMTIASAGHDPDGRSKTVHAKHLTRNILVTRAVRGAGSQKPVTVSKVCERAGEDRGVDLSWQIVKNAWDQLGEEWPQFYETTKDGQQALSIRGSDVTRALARAVEHDLGRDDLAKRFVGETGGGDA